MKKICSKSFCDANNCSDIEERVIKTNKHAETIWYGTS